MGRGKNKHQCGWSSTSFCKTFFFLFSETNVLNLALLALNSGDRSLFLFFETVLAYNLLIYLLKVRILG